MSAETFLVIDRDAAIYADALADAFPGQRILTANDVASALPLAADATVLIALAPAIPPAFLAAMPRLKWVHALTSGVDNLLTMPLPKNVALSNSAGFHGPQMSELAILLMLSLARRFPQMLANQRHHKWERWPQPILEGRTVCLLGLGAIAEALAQRCAAFGMTVTGVSDGRSEVPGFARIHRRAQLRDAVDDADFLVVIVPYSSATHHIVDADVLHAMKPSAYLVNIARGGCVDETALLAALDAGTIAGAGLDVFENEPLPENSPLWQHPKLIVTPHIGGMGNRYAEQALPIVLRNIEAWLAGAALPDQVRRDSDATA